MYFEKLGLTPIEERPGGARYECAGGGFALFQSTGAASGQHTQLAWQVEDIEATVRELRSRGVVFEEYDVPGLKTVDGIATVAGNYPSKGGLGEHAAWFKDSEGNLLGIGEAMKASVSAERSCCIALLVAARVSAASPSLASKMERRLLARGPRQ